MAKKFFRARFLVVSYFGIECSVWTKRYTPSCIDILLIWSPILPFPRSHSIPFEYPVNSKEHVQTSPPWRYVLYRIKWEGKANEMQLTLSARVAIAMNNKLKPKGVTFVAGLKGNSYQGTPLPKFHVDVHDCCTFHACFRKHQHLLPVLHTLCFCFCRIHFLLTSIFFGIACTYFESIIYTKRFLGTLYSSGNNCAIRALQG